MLTEAELISKLERTRDTYEGVDPINFGAKTVYLGGGWFTEHQQVMLLEAYKNLLRNPDIAYVHVPLLNQYEGNAVSEYSDWEPDEEWAIATYGADEEAMNNSNLMVALFDEEPDSGTAYEVGYMRSAHKPVVLVADFDTTIAPVNLMLAYGVRAHRSLQDLKTMNFRSIEIKNYKGKII